MEATARAYPGKTARARGLWGQERVCREELEEAPGSRQPRCARRCPFILHAGEIMETVEIQNLARLRFGYSHVTDTQEEKASCCSPPHAEHREMGQKKGGIKKVSWNDISYTHIAQTSPKQQLCSVPGRRYPQAGMMDILQLKPIVRMRGCLLPASQAKARRSTWQSLLRAATAQRAPCTHRKHTHNTRTCTHTQPCMQERASSSQHSCSEHPHGALPAQCKHSLAAARTKAQEQQKFSRIGALS